MSNINIAQMEAEIMQQLTRVEQILRSQELLTKSILNAKEAAQYLGISISTLYKATSNRTISYHKPHGVLYFSKEDLDAYMRSHRTPAFTVTNSKSSLL